MKTNLLFKTNPLTSHGDMITSKGVYIIFAEFNIIYNI